MDNEKYLSSRQVYEWLSSYKIDSECDSKIANPDTNTSNIQNLITPIVETVHRNMIVIANNRREKKALIDRFYKIGSDSPIQKNIAFTTMQQISNIIALGCSKKAIDCRNLLSRIFEEVIQCLSLQFNKFEICPSDIQFVILGHLDLKTILQLKSTSSNIKFIVNKYCSECQKSLSISNKNKIDWSEKDKFKNILLQSPRITRLDLSTVCISDQELLTTTLLTKLNYISINLNKKFNANCFTSLGEMTCLQAIEINSFKGMNNLSLKHFTAFTKLNMLILKKANIDDNNLKYLKTLTGLRKLALLYYDKSNITGSGFSHLMGLTSLKMLALNNCPISPIGASNIGNLTSLTQLDLEECDLNDDCLRFLSGLTSLKGIDFTLCDDVTDRGVSYLSGMTALKWLYANHLPLLSNKSLSVIAKFTNLERLCLQNNTELFYEGIGECHVLTNLKMLNLNNAKIDSIEFPQLKSLTKLQSLSLGNTFITLDCFKELTLLTNLNFLNISSCINLEKGDLRYLHNMTNLTDLSVAGMTFYSGNFSNITHLTNLKTVNLNDTKNISDYGNNETSEKICQLKLLPLKKIYLYTVPLTVSNEMITSFAESDVKVHSERAYFHTFT